MFNIFKKDPAKQDPQEESGEIVTDYYEGSVISSDFNVDDPDEYPFHSLYPHGAGKIVYTRNGEVVEEYEGEFVGGQYCGQGKLIRNGEVFEGTFKENKFVR